MCLDESLFHYFYRILTYLEIKLYSFNIVEIKIIMYLISNRFTLYYSIPYYTSDKHFSRLLNFITLKSKNKEDFCGTSCK